ncbi:MAG: hypothetical protein AB2421_14390 [Thermotaleaceae bacterium]
MIALLSTGYKEFFKEMITFNRFALILMMIAGLFAGFTYLLHRIFVKNSRIKYIPGILTLGTILYQITRVRVGTVDGFADLGRIILGMMLFSGFLANLSMAIGLDIIKYYRQKKYRS